MKKIFLIFILILNTSVLAAQKTNISGTYKLLYFETDKGLKITKKSKDSIVQIWINKELEDLDELPIHRRERYSLHWVKSKTDFMKEIFSEMYMLTTISTYCINIYSGYDSTTSTKENGTYTFNVATNEGVFEYKQKGKMTKGRFKINNVTAGFTYNPKLKTITILQENSHYALFAKMVYQKIK